MTPFSLPPEKKARWAFSPTSADAHWATSPTGALGHSCEGSLGMSWSPEWHTQVWEAISPATSSADAMLQPSHITHWWNLHWTSLDKASRSRGSSPLLLSFPDAFSGCFFIDAYAIRRRSEIPRLRLHPSFPPDSTRKRKDGLFTPAVVFAFWVLAGNTCSGSLWSN